MNRRLLALAVVLFAVGSSATRADAQQGRFEITPMVGWRSIGDISETDTAVYSKLQFLNPASFGLALSWNLRHDTSVELLYNYASSDVTAVARSGAVNNRTFNLKIHDVLFNGVYLFNTGNDKFRPFLQGGIGLGILAPDAANLQTLSRFAFSLGGGVKYYVSDRIGLRGDIRWVPMVLYSTEGGTWCDPFYGCYYTSNDHILSQWDFKLGAIVRF